MRSIIIGILLAASLASAQSARPHRVVVEVNVSGLAAYGLILNNVENLRRAFAPEPVEVEVVCHGPGIDMLKANPNRFAKRITELNRLGIRFAACANTLKGRHIEIRQLFPFVKVVKSGVYEVVSKQEAGWAYLKGAS